MRLSDVALKQRMVSCCPCCGGRQPKDGAGKYAPVKQDDLDEEEEADYCDDAPQVEGLDDPFAALQALRHLDFDATNNSDDEGEGDRGSVGGDGAQAGRLGSPAEEPLRFDGASVSKAGRLQSDQEAVPKSSRGRGAAGPPASSIAVRAESGRRGLTIGDMEIDFGWRKPAANEVLSAAAAKARSGLAAASGGTPSKNRPHEHYGRGQQHPAAMRKLIGGGTAHPESMTRQLKMQFDPAAEGMKSQMSSWKAKLAAKSKAAIEKARDKTRSSGVT